MFPLPVPVFFRCRRRNYDFFMAARFLKVGSRIFFRIRRFLGVTSRSSSVSMNSRHCSRLKIRGGVSFSASSALEERVLVSFLVLQTFSSISSALPFCQMTMPAYTFSPGPIKRVPRS